MCQIFSTAVALAEASARLDRLRGTYKTVTAKFGCEAYIRKSGCEAHIRQSRPSLLSSGRAGRGVCASRQVASLKRRGNTFYLFYGHLPERQGQNLALTVLYVPYSLAVALAEASARLDRLRASACRLKTSQRHFPTVSKAQLKQWEND